MVWGIAMVYTVSLSPAHAAQRQLGAPLHACSNKTIAVFLWFQKKLRQA
jgi:hypothetical protein